MAKNRISKIWVKPRWKRHGWKIEGINGRKLQLFKVSCHVSHLRGKYDQVKNTRVECSLAGHQFLLFRATLFRKVIEENVTHHTELHNKPLVFSFFFFVISYISIILG